MNFSLIFNNSSPWWIILCIALGFSYAFILYRNNKTFSERTRKILFALRFICVTFLALLLLTPLFKSITRIVEKPIIIIAQDNSSSILLNKDSSFYKGDYRKQMNELIEKLEDQYTVKTYSFGDQLSQGISYTFVDKETALSDVFEELNTRYFNQNVGAVILSSDGIYNKGNNPLYSKLMLNAPVYTVALGDTNPQRDILVSHVNYNRIVYLGNDFQLNVTVNASGCRGEKTLLTVVSEGNLLFSREISFNTNSFISDIPIQLTANKPGIRKYSIRLRPVEKEISFRNNVQDIYIEVLDGKEKILLLAKSPHPDLGAIRQALEGNRNYLVDIAFINDFDVSSIGQYGTVILHQLPAQGDPASAVFARLKTANIPQLFILGNQSHPDLFNRSQQGLILSNTRNQFNEAQAKVSPDFYQFTLSTETRDILSKFPPLLSPFGTYSFSGNAMVLLRQRIGFTDTDYPLLVFFENTPVKTAVLCGEGIWKWRLHNFTQTGNHEAVNEMLTKTVQYLSTRENKRKFQVSAAKNSFAENEQVILNAELYNDSYELVNTPDVGISMTNEKKQTYKFTFSRTEHAYMLNAGVLPAGEYHYTAATRLGEKNYTTSGQFNITVQNAEELQTRADHQLLYNLALRSGGTLVYPDKLDVLASLIEDKEDIRSVSYEQKKLEEMIHIKWFFFLLLALLTAEWVIKKLNGAY